MDLDGFTDLELAWIAGYHAPAIPNRPAWSRDMARQACAILTARHGADSPIGRLVASGNMPALYMEVAGA